MATGLSVVLSSVTEPPGPDRGDGGKVIGPAVLHRQCEYEAGLFASGVSDVWHGSYIGGQSDWTCWAE